MPSTKPRIMLTVNEETHAVLLRFSKATGKPMGAFIAEVLDQSRPMIEALTAAAIAQKNQQIEALEAVLEPLQSGASAASRELHEQLDGFTRDAKRQVAKRRKKAA